MVGLEPASATDSGSPVVASTEDLARTIVFSKDQPPLAEGGNTGQRYADVGNFYVRNNTTNTYQLLIPGGGEGKLSFADATSDGSRILLETSAQLTEGAEEGKPNLYVWDEGTLSLVAADAVAGPSNFETGPAGGAAGGYYTQYTISQDGSRIFLTDLANGQIYAYSRSEGRAIDISPGPAQWRDATPDGKLVFYTEGVDKELYRFNIEAAEDGENNKPEPLASDAVGMLGISTDGSYAYFADNDGNIYEWHEGSSTLIGNVSTFYDNGDWFARCNCNGVEPGEGEKTSRVSASGEVLLFTRLTGNFFAIYRYEAANKKLACVSCNPTGAPATKSAFLLKKPPFFSATSSQVFLTRNLSANGDRVFFQTEEALVHGDVNHQSDVYEWEREGSGSCVVGSGNNSGGCLYLISTGTSSTAESYFGNADAEGDNVFFFTRQSLVGQDQDYNADLYDARVNGGMESQNLPPVPTCTTEEVCRGALPLAPELGVPSSATFAGTGNLAPQAEAKEKPKTKPTKLKGKKKKRKSQKRKNKAKELGGHRERRRGA